MVPPRAPSFSSSHRACGARPPGRQSRPPARTLLAQSPTKQDVRSCVLRDSRGRRLAVPRVSVGHVAEASDRTVAIIGAALDLGQGRRGVDMGPSAMRAAGLEDRLRSLGYEVRDLGNVDTPEPEETALEDERARFLPEIKEACARIAALVATRPPRVRSRWFSAAITRSRSGRSQGSRRRTGRAACSGSTRTPTSTRPKRARAATSTACRSRPPWASPASSRATRGLSRQWTRAASP